MHQAAQILTRVCVHTMATHNCEHLSHVILLSVLHAGEIHNLSSTVPMHLIVACVHTTDQADKQQIHACMNSLVITLII